MSKYILYTKVRCVLFELMLLHTKMLYVRTCVTRKICLVSKVCNVRTCYTRKYDVACLMSEHILHTNRRLFSIRTNVIYENV